MKVCHVCKTECEDFAELCPLCGADLTVSEQITEEETGEKLLLNPVLLASFEDIVSAEIFKDILSDNAIGYSSGNDDGEIAVQVRFGGSFVSEDIYVDASDYEKADVLYKEFLESEAEMTFEFDDEEFNEDI